MKILITGGAGFIGSAVAAALAGRGDEVTIIDNLNTYYNPALKEARLREIGIASAGDGVSSRYPSLRFRRLDITDADAVDRLFAEGHFTHVCHLAAQAGVRYSIDHPRTYIETNILGYFNVLDACRRHGVRRLVYASSSSVYGGNTKTPFSEADRVDNPRSLYAATKKSDELMAHVYTSIYGMGTTGLRYFTVYGPWGRPDMSPVLFANAITEGRPIRLFNGGDMIRDFTYISDIVRGTVLAIDAIREGEANVYNIGCSHPVKLMDFVRTLEEALGRKAEYEMLPMQAGDVYVTSADTSLITRTLGYHPTVSIDEGLRLFAKWYRAHRDLLVANKG
jgi:UDP-glucuronate 4-epimerase